MTKRVVVLASGGGTNFQSIIDAKERGELDVELVLLITNVPGAGAIVRAEKHGIPVKVLDHKGMKRAEHENMVVQAILDAEPDLIVLAGYVRMLTPSFFGKLECPIMNIHPALLPNFGGPGFYGEKVHEAVLASGCKVSGCTVHFVTPEVDGGPIIVQRCVEVMEDDTPETLAKRILSEEHRAYPEAIKLFAEDRLAIMGNRALVLEEGIQPDRT